MRLWIGSVAALALCWCSAAHAQSFDGVYYAPQGGATGSRACGTTRFAYPLHVSNGQASLQTVSQGQVQGRVAPDGSVSMQQGNASVTGKITGSQFMGRLQVKQCAFDLNYSKR